MIARSTIVIVAVVALFVGHIAALAGEPSSSFLTNTPSFNTAPPHLIYYGEDQKLIFDIAPDGKVTLGAGVSADQASAAFWTAVQQMGLKLTTNCETK